MRTMPLGVGVVLAILIAIVAYLFALVNITEMFALLLILVGLWTLSFAVFAAGADNLYIGVWGVVLILLSTFIALPIAYTIGLVLVGVIGAIIYTYVAGPSASRHGSRRTAPPPPPPPPRE
jgi:hypothetical protein